MRTWKGSGRRGLLEGLFYFVPQSWALVSRAYNPTSTGEKSLPIDQDMDMVAHEDKGIDTESNIGFCRW
ncbi:MAG TPA: hypothetical protein VN328_02335 [Thermodesulfovibrionales bacterium]|nr:hypothetical protein [Thermodesulfovibrionales bacterium]